MGGYPISTTVPVFSFVATAGFLSFVFTTAFMTGFFPFVFTTAAASGFVFVVFPTGFFETAVSTSVAAAGFLDAAPLFAFAFPFA